LPGETTRLGLGIKRDPIVPIPSCEETQLERRGSPIQ
jgi:hypothetical protein